MRVLVQICDYDRQKRGTAYAYKAAPDPEDSHLYDLYFGASGEALRDRTVVAKNISPHERPPSVWPELTSLIAAPIYNPTNRGAAPLGVLIIDSDADLHVSKFDCFETKHNIQLAAEIISSLLVV